MRQIYKSLVIIAAAGSVCAHADRVAYFPMEVAHGEIVENVSGGKASVQAATVIESISGVKDDAWRLDGYSNFASFPLGLGTLDKLTFSVWTAMETWPIIEHDMQNESDMTCIVGNYDSVNKKGFGFYINRVGRLVFKFYSQGWPGEIAAAEKMPLYEWCNLVAVADGKNVAFYCNGVLQGTAKARGIDGDGLLMIGKGADCRSLGKFSLGTINGIIDEIEIFDNTVDEASIKAWQTDQIPMLTVAGDDKYASDIMRPRFHGMPSRNWTNETHGLIHHNGKYHLFFQKNANGPYMSRLQWGHLVSDNLYDWHEMPIALGSDKWYDLKGCWSGCVAVDDVVTGGEPAIIYTGVDYARAMIGQASPADDQLQNWTKKVNPIIDGKPSGLSDDFRDPYFFRNGADAYIMVGTSKDGKGACTLHKYNPANKTWTNDGKIFFSASSVAGQGSFWEMPNLTDMGGTYLFTATPQGIAGGVKAIYCTGSINADGTFSADTDFASVELPGFAKEGFGLLSPSIMQAHGKTIVIGIVPDKLSGADNYSLGWAHTYSLPREWCLDADGHLVQKPYSGLEAMRDPGSCVTLAKSLSAGETLCDMPNRQIEVVGEFTVADADFGFTFYKGVGNGVKLTYSPASGKLSVDMRGVDRLVNDNRVFDGLYETYLPEPVAKGSTMKLHVFVDHSIMDIFVNDRWASSVRVFPTDAQASSVEVFSESGATQAAVSAWSLDASLSGIADVIIDGTEGQDSEYVDVYSVSGMLLRKGVHRSQATAALDSGLYIVGSKKVLVK